MRGGWALVKKELRVLAFSPGTWVFVSLFLLVSGAFFFVSVGTAQEASLRPALPNLVVALIFCIPLLTMHQLAGEERDGTLDLLLTSPASPLAVVLAKWGTSVWVCFCLVACLGAYAVLLSRWGEPDPAVVLTTLLGLWCCCAVFCAAGLLASATSREPLVAAALALGLTLPLWLVSALRGVLPDSLAPVVDRVAIGLRLRSFSMGVLDLGDLAWFAAVTGIFLVGCWQVLESRRWR